MKKLIDYFSSKAIVFKSLRLIDKAHLRTRKKVTIFTATDLKGNYHSIFIVGQKSRFLIKHFMQILELEERLVELENHNFKYKHLIIGEAICSKVVNNSKERGWNIYHDFM